MQQGSSSPMKYVDVTQTDPLVVVPAELEMISLIASHYERTNKRDFFDSMETEEEGTAQTPKKQKVEKEVKMIQVTETK